MGFLRSLKIMEQINIYDLREYGLDRPACCTTYVLYVFVTVIKYSDQKQFGEKRIYFVSHFQVTVTTGGSQGRNFKQGKNIEAGTDAVAME